MKRANHLMSAALILMAFALGSAQTSEFQEPWKDAHQAIVIDPYQENEIIWADVATDPRVAGIIHRATIGKRKDTKYAERKAEATRHGYRWGSYHLGKPGNPIKQADFYLYTVKPSADEVITLDIEGLNPATDMSLANARRFIRRIHKKTGRYLLLYANQAVVKQISDSYRRHKIFSKTPLWYARFKSLVTDFPTTTCETYTLWQFSSEINCNPDHPEDCLYRVPGTQTDMDVNVYQGTVDELKANWPFKRD